MSFNRTLIVALLAVFALTAAATSTAQIPQTMNYQVMLTDNLDEPLADQSVQLVFRIYDVDAGGGALWNETHNTVTNSIGVASVLLGSVSPLSLLFDTPLWLQVEVDGETMSPRRPLSAAPYALRARDADYLGGEPAQDYALDDDLWQPGTLNNPANPLEWTKLKSVPAGFADGIDNAGTGDGHSLDASDGSPVDVVYVDPDGKVGVNLGSSVGRLSVSGGPTEVGGYFWADSSSPFYVGAIASSDSSSGVVGNTGELIGSYTVPTLPAGVAGTARGPGDGGSFWGLGTGRGIFATSFGAGTAVAGFAAGTGNSGHFSGGDGVLAELSSGSPVLMARNYETTSDADAAWFTSEEGAPSYTWNLYSRCYGGRAGYFNKYTDDNAYVGYFANQIFDSEGIYVYGTVVSTGSVARVVETSRGREAVLGVSSADLEVIASGKGRLTGGAARVEFDRLFSESISGAEGLRVTATPVGGWSALYVARIDGDGFDLRSDAGDRDVEFHWVAVGRAAGGERRPEITIPENAEAERLATQRKEAEAASRRPENDERPGVVTVNGASH